jgi:hypothetical protein
MAAPAVTARATPAGRPLERGFKPWFSFGLLPTLGIWQFSITPGKMSGGPPIITSTFFNNYVHTKVPQVLVDLGPFTVRGKYDPDIFKNDGTFTPSASNQFRSLINRIGAVTFHFPAPNAGTLSNYGWLREIDFGEFKEGDTTPPTVTMSIEISSWDPVNLVETEWSYVDGYTGTSGG